MMTFSPPSLKRRISLHNRFIDSNRIGHNKFAGIFKPDAPFSIDPRAAQSRVAHVTRIDDTHAVECVTPRRAIPADNEDEFTTVTYDLDKETNTMVPHYYRHKAPVYKAPGSDDEVIQVGRHPSCPLHLPDGFTSNFQCRLFNNGYRLGIASGAYNNMRELVLSQRDPYHWEKYSKSVQEKINSIELYRDENRTDGFCCAMTMIVRKGRNIAVSSLGVPYTIEDQTSVPGKICSEEMLGITKEELFERIRQGEYEYFPLEHGDIIRIGRNSIRVNVEDN